MDNLNNEQIIIENFKEQRNAIIDNIKVETIALENILRKKSDAEQSYNDVCNKTDAAITQLKNVTELCSQRDLRSAKREDEVAIRETNLSDNIERFETTQKLALEFLHSEESRVSAALNEMNKEITESASVLDKKNKEIAAINLDIENLKLTKDEWETKKLVTIKDYNETEKKLELEKQDKLSQISKITNELKRLGDELILANRAVNAEREKIAKPMQLLEAAQADIDKKQRNLNILLDRAKKYYKILYPGQEPII